MKEDQITLFAEQKLPDKPLSLHEAMARALKYNLDLRQKNMEEALSRKQGEVTELEMLPRLVTSAGYSSRSPEDASISKSVLSGSVSKEASVSSDAISKNGDLTLSWNWLDFGVSYFQTRQDGNKALVQHEYRRKAAHNLIRDVRFAFWKATAAQSLENNLNAIRKESEQALEEARTAEQEGLRSPTYSLQFQLGMMETMRQIEKSLAELSQSREELALLIHLPPGTPYQLRDDSNTMMTSLGASVTPETLEQIALSSRPELLIERYQGRIEADETRKAIARLFPGLEFNLSKNYDSNSYLVNQHWAQVGARLSWNLLRTFTGQSQLDLSKERENVVRTRRLVAHMAVLSQTRIAYQEYRTSEKMLHRAIIESAIRQRMQNHAADRSALGLESQLSYVHAAAAYLLGRIQQYEAYARYQSALGHLYATLGLDPLQDGSEHEEIDQLVRHLQENESRWQQMIFPGAKPTSSSGKETNANQSVTNLLEDYVGSTEFR
ncbi:MAG: TolC family protein [Magnetococcales bacterium]|nr:TolC family protein [Magnetococcales bacterium]